MLPKLKTRQKQNISFDNYFKDAIIVDYNYKTSKYFEDENLWKWHDLYDHGFIDSDGFGTDFPFMNNIHYVKNDIDFYLRNEKLYTNKNDGIKKVDKFNC